MINKYMGVGKPSILSRWYNEFVLSCLCVCSKCVCVCDPNSIGSLLRIRHSSMEI